MAQLPRFIQNIRLWMKTFAIGQALARDIR